MVQALPQYMYGTTVIAQNILLCMLCHVMNTSFIAGQAGQPGQRGWAWCAPGDLMLKGGESVVNQNQLIMNNEIRRRERDTARRAIQTIEQRQLNMYLPRR